MRGGNCLFFVDPQTDGPPATIHKVGLAILFLTTMKKLEKVPPRTREPIRTDENCLFLLKNIYSQCSQHYGVTIFSLN